MQSRDERIKQWLRLYFESPSRKKRHAICAMSSHLGIDENSKVFDRPVGRRTRAIVSREKTFCRWFNSGRSDAVIELAAELGLVMKIYSWDSFQRLIEFSSLQTRFTKYRTWFPIAYLFIARFVNFFNGGWGVEGLRSPSAGEASRVNQL